jgi:hypothetical protein
MNKFIKLLTGVLIACCMTTVSANASQTLPNLDNSIAVLNNGVLSAKGLNNVLSFAGGIPINDGNVHTVSTAPLGSPFHGITTLAGLAALTVNGTTPFSFLTDSGSVTGPACTNGTTTNCFTNSGGAYALTNTNVSALDISWLAIQAALMTHKTYIPAGTYILDSTKYLPLLIPNVSQASGYATNSDIILGDGEDKTYLQPAIDEGAGTRVMWCGDPAGTFSNNLGRYEGNDGQCTGTMTGITFNEPTGAAVYGAAGAALTSMGGLSWGARLNLFNISGRGLNCSIGIVGDHSLMSNVSANGGANGICYDPGQSTLKGDITFIDLVASGQTQNAIYVSAGASISDTFVGETYLSAPVDIGGQTDSNCTNLITTMDVKGKLFAEYTGNRVINDYTSTPCRAALQLDIPNIQYSFTSGSHWTASNVNIPEFINVGDISGTLGFSGVEGESVNPPTTYGSVPAVINVTAIGNGQGGLTLVGDLDEWIGSLGSIPIINGNVDTRTSIYLKSDSGWTGGINTVSTDGNYATSQFGGTAIGDVLEPDSYGVSGAGRNYFSNSPVIGIVKQAGILQNEAVPYAYSGDNISLRTGWNSGFWNTFAKSTGIGKLALVAGSGYTNGTYTWTATAGCSTEPTGSVIVAGGILSSYTITSPGGSGCNGALTIPIPGGAGSGTGGSITAEWPGGAAISSTTPLTVGEIGYNDYGGNGNTTNGTQIILTHLTGLK